MAASFTLTGLDASELFAAFEAYGEVVIDEAAGEMAALGERLVERMRDVLLKAVTRTGLERAARGGRPGRYETGAMHDNVGYEITVERDADGATIVLDWGWLVDLDAIQRPAADGDGGTADGNYFLIQDYGLDGIPAAGSLADSFTLAIAETARILQGVAR